MTGEVIGPTENPITAVLLSEHIVHCLLNIYVFDHRLLLLPALAKAASFINGWWLMPRLIIGQIAESK